MTHAPPAAEANSTPSLELRAEPPSPKRLSRKMVVIGLGFGCAIIAFALVNGLSPPAPREPSEIAQQSAHGPPDTIRMAQSDYDAHDLTRGPLHAQSPDTLAPPDEQFWAEPGPAERSLSHPQAARGPNQTEIDPLQTARRSAILFNIEPRDAAQTQDPQSASHLPRLSPPRSRYELQAGHVIPAALLTALNSDVPGRIIAQVTAPVYDSVSGQHLLIPQGARLIGMYRSGANYGDRRLFLSWTRLILPNGWSIELGEMDGADSQGRAGVAGHTDRHLDRLAAAIGLSSVISVIANNAQSSEQRSLRQSLGDAAAQQAAQTGARIVDRELSVRPTINVRAGAPVRVLIMRDITLLPYREQVR